MKAGILEVADLFVVNKSDHPDADKTVEYLKNIFRRAPAGVWVPPIIRTQALHHRGIDDLWEAIQRHNGYRQAGSEAYRAQQLSNARRELKSFLKESLELALNEKLDNVDGINQSIENVASGKTDIYAAVDQILDELGLSGGVRNDSG